MGYEKSKYFRVCRGVEDDLHDTNEFQGIGELFWWLDT